MTVTRRHSRKPVKVHFWCRNESAFGDLALESENISPGGAFLETDKPFEVGDPLEIELPLPGRTLRAEARVAWVRPYADETGNPGVGIAFIAMSDEDRRAFAQVVAGG